MEKLKEFKYIILIALVILGFAFYWFEWRPIQTNKECASWALNKAMTDANSYDQNTYDDYYKRCQREKGL